MKRITENLLKKIVRQSLNETYGLLNEEDFQTGKINYKGNEYEDLTITTNPCPRGGFCLTPYGDNSPYKNASKWVKETQIPQDYSGQIEWMNSVIALCSDENYKTGEANDESTINSTVDEIIGEMDDTAIDEDFIGKKIKNLVNFPSFCIANDYSNRMSYNIFDSHAEGRVNGGGSDNTDYLNYIVKPVFNLLQKSIDISKKEESKFLAAVETATKTQKPKTNVNTGGGGQQTPDLDINACPCILSNPAIKLDKKEPIPNGYGYKLDTNIPFLNGFIFGVVKDPNIPDSRLECKMVNSKTPDILLNLDCETTPYIQYSLSSDPWNYDDIIFSDGAIALTTNPDLEDDGQLNNSVQLESKGFRYKLLTEAEYKFGDKGDEVGKIQAKLGLPPDKGTPIFGNKTKQAVIDFQKTEGAKLTPPLRTDGIVDDATYAAIIAKPDPVLPSATVYTRDLKRGMTGEDVVNIQDRLGVSTKGGYGPETETAVLNFQKKYTDLDDTGIVDQKTFEKILKVKPYGAKATFSGKKHNYKVGEWVKVNPEPGNEAMQLSDNNGYFKIIKILDDYTIVINAEWGSAKSYATVGGSTQKVLFGEFASEGSKTIIKRDRTKETEVEVKRTETTSSGSGRRLTTTTGNNRSTVNNTSNSQVQTQRKLRNQETCTTLRQIKQYLNNTKGLSMPVNCKWNQETRNQVMMALTGESPVVTQQTTTSQVQTQPIPVTDRTF